MRDFKRHFVISLFAFVFTLTATGSAEARFQMTKPNGSRRKIPKVTIREIQTLDSQIQALNVSLETQMSPDPQAGVGTASTNSANSTGRDANTNARACSIDSKTRDSMLQSKRQILDQKISDYVAPKIHAQGSISIADSDWPRECAKSCHCAIYKQILETAGSERLSEGDRKIYQSLTDLAMNQPLTERARCASEGLKEICHSSH